MNSDVIDGAKAGLASVYVSLGISNAAGCRKADVGDRIWATSLSDDVIQPRRVTWLGHPPTSGRMQSITTSPTSSFPFSLATPLLQQAENFRILQHWTFYWATVCKKVRPMLSNRCSVLYPVCNVGALWSNAWMDQDETWHTDRPRPWPHYVRRGPSFPSQRGTAPISAHICCGQMAGCIKMPLGMEVVLGPGDFVLDGDPAVPSPKRRRSPPIFGPCPLWPNGWMD